MHSKDRLPPDECKPSEELFVSHLILLTQTFDGVVGSVGCDDYNSTGESQRSILVHIGIRYELVSQDVSGI